MTTELVEIIDDWILPRPALAEMLHAIQLRRFGGGAGIRDRALLQSAVSRGPAILAWSDAPDLVEAACAMGEGVIRNHPFIDGNKRTGFAIITSTLHANGFRFEMPPMEAAQMIVDFAATRISSDEFRQIMRAHSLRDSTPEAIEALSGREGSDPALQEEPENLSP